MSKFWNWFHSDGFSGEEESTEYSNDEDERESHWYGGWGDWVVVEVMCLEMFYKAREDVWDL